MAALTQVTSRGSAAIPTISRTALARLVDPIEHVTAGWLPEPAAFARNRVLIETLRRRSAYWTWPEAVWMRVVPARRSYGQQARFQVAALGYLFGGHHRLHQAAGLVRLAMFADLVFGPGAITPAIDDIVRTLRAWGISDHRLPFEVPNATIDALLTCGSPHLRDINEQRLRTLADDHARSTSRRNRLVKPSRVLADRNIIHTAISGNERLTGARATTLATVPAPWLEWAHRWSRLSTHEPSTVRGMFAAVLVAGRWAADKHPEALTPDAWTRDIAAEYVADTMTARIGDWAGPTTRKDVGRELRPAGKARRLEGVRGFFTDLTEWEWITGRFDPGKVFALPRAVRAGLGPNQRIIDDAAWAKLMAAGLTLDAADLNAHCGPQARAGRKPWTFYPIERHCCASGCCGPSRRPGMIG